MCENLDYRKLAIVAALPHAGWMPNGGENELEKLVGAKIMSIGGTSDEVNIEGGGLIIDYLPQWSATPWRMVVGFNDQGMWIEFNGQL
ncbi:MAG: hypothetical protein R3D68_07180 [Hyphomicrobiaceae bacterium]